MPAPLSLTEVVLRRELPADPRLANQAIARTVPGRVWQTTLLLVGTVGIIVLLIAVEAPILVAVGAGFAFLLLVGSVMSINARDRYETTEVQRATIREGVLTLSNHGLDDVVVDLRKPHAAILRGRLPLQLELPEHGRRVFFRFEGHIDAEFGRLDGGVPMPGRFDPVRPPDFGDALLATMLDHLDQNEYLKRAAAWVARTRAPERADVVTLPEEAEGNAPFRAAADPDVDSPDYPAWLEREGIAIAPGVVLGCSHLVITQDGCGIAHPLGHVPLRSQGDELRVNAPTPIRLIQLDPVDAAALEYLSLHYERALRSFSPPAR